MRLGGCVAAVTNVVNGRLEISLLVGDAASVDNNIAADASSVVYGSR